VLDSVLALSIVDNRAEYDYVFDIYLPIGIGVFVLFSSVIVVCAIRARRRPPGDVSRRSENNPLEASYAVVLAGVVAFLLAVTFSAEHQIDTVSLREKPAVTIDVIGSKWEWTFYYPALGVEHRSGTVGHQSLVVPVDEPIRFEFTSRDVIHAFWIPEIGFKRDAIPGATEVVVLDFDRRGRFLGHCAQFCGLRHADMWFPVEVVSVSRFRTWAASRGRVEV
jgi:cytochrome c oxidase subunit II